jgi:homoserine kinase type II
MSVFTTLTPEEVQAWLQKFAVGELADLKGIAAGITNTNYFVTTNQSRFVLTIFEKNALSELNYFVDLMTHLAKQGIPCPQPVCDKQGVALHVLHGKPALMVTCLQGNDIAVPSLDDVKQVAKTLANLHTAGQTFKALGINQRDEQWRDNTAQKVAPFLASADQQMLQKELDYQHSLDLSSLPHGVVHGDLFRDNVLFNDNKLSGIIDLYYACDDILLYDVAIAVNEWCLHHNGPDIGTMDEDKMQCFIEAYQAKRPFSKLEWKLWLAMLRRAALRFWLSRLYDFHFPADGDLTHTKDPNHFKKILEYYIDLADDLGD